MIPLLAIPLSLQIVLAGGKILPLTVLDKAAPGSWIWASGGVEMEKDAGGGDYAGFPVLKEERKDGGLSFLVQVKACPAEAAFHAGFPLKADWTALDLKPWVAGFLAFEVKGETGREDVLIGLMDDHKPHAAAALPLSSYAKKYGGRWTRVRIPLADLVKANPAFDMSRAHQVELMSLSELKPFKLLLAQVRIES